MLPDITTELAGLTSRVIAYRMVRLIQEGKLPLIEIKGLGSAVADARKAIADVRTQTSGLQTDAANLVAALQDVRQQINQAHDDLKFEAQTLGNGAPDSSQQSSVSQQPSPQQASQQAPQAQQSTDPSLNTRDSSGQVIHR